MRHIIILSLFCLSILFIACNPQDIWENDNDDKDVSSVDSFNNTRVVIIYNYEVGKLTAEDPLNYSIDGLDVLSAVRDDVDLTRVELATSSQSDIEYTVVITNVERIDGELIDTTGDSDTFTGDGLPYVTGVVVNSSSSITINFSEDVDSTGAGNTTNYSIEGVDLSILSVMSATTSGANVTLVTDYQNDIEYTVTVSSITDINGNSIDIANNTGTFIGNSCPRLVNVIRYPNNNVDVVFSEAVEETTAETLTNYTVIQGLGILSAIRDSIDHQIVHLVTASQSDQTYTLRVSNIEDLSGNVLDPNPSTCDFEGDAAPYVVDINDNGTVTLEIEYSENMGPSALVIANYQLYNTDSAEYINITHTAIGSTDNVIRLTLEHDLLPPPLPPTTGTGIYELTISSSIQDDDGNNLLEPYIILFTYPIP